VEKKTYGIILVGILIVFAVYWFLLREPDVSNQRERARDVIQSLDSAGAEQRNAESHLVNVGRGIDESLGRVDDVAERIDGAAEGIADVQKRSRECARVVEDSERRIGESQRIIQRVRARAGQN